MLLRLHVPNIWKNRQNKNFPLKKIWDRKEIHYNIKQAGTGSSRRHIQGSKIAKGIPRVNLQYSIIEKAKNGPRCAPGPASASPWHAKRGTLPFLSTILSQLKGDLSMLFWKKNKLPKKVSQCRKTERGDPLGFLNPQSVLKYQRN